MTREEAIECLRNKKHCEDCKYYQVTDNSTIDQTCWDEAIHMAIEALERQHGEWVERNVTQDRRDAKIPEWQSAKCSVCGKYHTTPYMYYFTNYDYCPNCGSRMKEVEDER